VGRPLSKPSRDIYACARTIECFTQNARRCKIRNLIKATGILYLICMLRLSDQKLCTSSVETTPGRLIYPEISRGPPELDTHSLSSLLALTYGLRSSISLSKSGFHKNRQKWTFTRPKPTKTMAKPDDAQIHVALFLIPRRHPLGIIST
jgi:hypothetical protein